MLKRRYLARLWKCNVTTCRRADFNHVRLPSMQHHQQVLRSHMSRRCSHTTHLHIGQRVRSPRGGDCIAAKTKLFSQYRYNLCRKPWHTHARAQARVRSHKYYHLFIYSSLFTTMVENVHKRREKPYKNVQEKNNKT